MEIKKIDTTRYLVRLDPGDEVVRSLAEAAEKCAIRLAMVQGLGAAKRIIMGVYDVGKQEYKSNTLEGVYEILSLTGTLDTMNGEHYSHLHISVGDASGHAFGGHLNEAVISATAEIVITCLPGQIDRVKSAEVGLNIWKFE